MTSFLKSHLRQWGFQEGKSATNAILSAVNEYIQLRSSSSVFDIQKAFDSVPGIPCHLIRWIVNYLYEAFSAGSSRWRALSTHWCCIQGSVLGPILFLIYIDGLCGIHLSSGNTMLFADDLLLHSRISQPSDFIALQKDVNELCNNYVVAIGPVAGRLSGSPIAGEAGQGLGFRRA